MGLRVGVVVFACAVSAYSQQTPTSFSWDERWQYYVHRTYSAERLGLLALDTGIDHALGNSGCRRSPRTYPDAYLRGFTRRVARTSIEFGVGGLLGEDARRRPSGETGLTRRLRYVIGHAWVARGPEGQLRPAYGRFAGTLGGVLVSRGWEGRSFACHRVMGDVTSSVAFSIQDSLFTEFEPDLRRFGKNLGRGLLRAMGH